MTLDDHDAFAFDDAAYVLGALSETERAAYEAHLAGCEICAERVAQLRSTVRTLGTVSEHDVARAGVPAPEEADASGVPAGVLPLLLARATRQRRIQRWTMGGLAGTAAAAVAALAVVVVTQLGAGPAQTATAAQQTMVPISQSVPLRATASLVSKPWGTSISVDCVYTRARPQGPTYAGSAPSAYGLRVTDRDGVRYDLGSWTLRPGADAHFTSGVAVPVSRVRDVEIVLPDGTPVMRLAG